MIVLKIIFSRIFETILKIFYSIGSGSLFVIARPDLIPSIHIARCLHKRNFPKGTKNRKLQGADQVLLEFSQ